MEIASVRATLPANYEFVFVNGPSECDAAPGISDVYAGPYRCWYNTPTTAKVKMAHEFVEDFMREQGPFDGVMGFSQARIRRHSQASQPFPCTLPFRPFFLFLFLFTTYDRSDSWRSRG